VLSGDLHNSLDLFCGVWKYDGVWHGLIYGTVVRVQQEIIGLRQQPVGAGDRTQGRKEWGALTWREPFSC
jgi:hypothetical protein